MVPVHLKEKGIQLLCYFQLVYFNGIITVKISVEFWSILGMGNYLIEPF